MPDTTMPTHPVAVELAPVAEVGDVLARHPEKAPSLSRRQVGGESYDAPHSISKRYNHHKFRAHAIDVKQPNLAQGL